MTLPVLESFCRAYPDIELTLLTTKLAAKIAQTVIDAPNFRILVINKADYSGLMGMDRLYRMLKVHQFDAIADLHDVLRTKWVRFRFRLAGFAVKVIDKGRKEKKALVSHREAIHQLADGFARYQQVFSELGLPFDVNYDGKAAAARLSAPALTMQTPAIGIAPFAQHQGKIYPKEMMFEVIEQLLQKSADLHIYLFGGKEDAPVLEQWKEAHPDRITNLAGAQTIDEDIRVMARLQAMVSMDSANMHMASLVGTRCFSIWGATHRFAGFLGYGQQAADCIELDLPCRPCSIYGNKPCRFGDYNCLTHIPAKQVADAILS